LGYVDRAKRLPFVKYGTILDVCGGDTDKERKAYWRNVCDDLSKEIDIRERIVGGSVLGSDEFISWVKEKLLGKEMREVPSVKKVLSYRAKDEIVSAISEETGKKFGVVGDVDYVTESGGLINLVLVEPTPHTASLNLQTDEKNRLLVPFSAVKSVGDFVIVSEKDII